MKRRVLFRGEEYVFIGPGPSFAEGGAIARAWEYESFAFNHAHLFPDGRIRRYGEEIGSRADLIDVGPYE